jgi:hypothetical protein
MSEIKIMRKQDFLRVEPGGTPGHTMLERGDKVDVKGTKDGWSRVQAKLGDEPIGWVLNTSLSGQEVEVIDKKAFAQLCWDLELRFGISAHYLAAVAELRSKTTENRDERDGFVGPFRLSQFEFEEGRKELEGDFKPGDIFNWRMETAVFAAMTRRAEDQLEKLLGQGQRASAAELVLAQMLGPQAAATLIKTPTTTVGAALQDVKDRDQLLQRHGLSADKTGEMTLQKIADDLTPALKAVEPFITEAGASIVAEVVAALPVGGGAADGTIIRGSGNYSEIYPEGVVVQGQDLVVRNAKASYWDDKKTASGVDASGPNVRGCALPLPASTLSSGTPFPMIKWHTKVHVKNREKDKETDVELIDIGPSAKVRSRAGVDLTPSAFTDLGEDLKKGIITVDFTVIGGARFLPNDTRAAAPGSTTGGSDRDRIPALIEIAKDPNKLKQIYDEARPKVPGFPNNGCAITLSILLQKAGIGIRSETMAWELGKKLEARGWQRVSVGEQQAGDVGSTCLENDHRHGKDHIYLVVEARGQDEMIVADNQYAQGKDSATETPRTHIRYASHETLTTHFLRARGNLRSDFRSITRLALWGAAPGLARP